MCVISVYSDESGTFSPSKKDLFVFAGLLYFQPKLAMKAQQRYWKEEIAIRGDLKSEFKAANASISSQDRLIDTQLNEYKFAVVIRQKALMKEIDLSPKVWQRYLDYAYRVGLGKCLKNLLAFNLFPVHQSNSIYLRLDYHNCAIDQCYELGEWLELNLRYGSFDENWSQYRKPIFPTLTHVDVGFLDSKDEPLIRAADMLANRILNMEAGTAEKRIIPNLTLVKMPEESVEITKVD